MFYIPNRFLMKFLNKFVVILTIILFMTFFSIPCYGFINRISGFAYRLQERVINGYILYDSMKSFEYMSHAIFLYLTDYSDLVSEFVADNNWYDRLKRDKVITDAYVRSKKQSFTVGNVFLHRFMKETVSISVVII